MRQVAQSNISFAGQFSNIISPENPFAPTTQQNMTLANGGTGASSGAPSLHYPHGSGGVKHHYGDHRHGADRAGPLLSSSGRDRGSTPGSSSSDSDDDDSAFSDEKYEQLQRERHLKYQQ